MTYAYTHSLHFSSFWYASFRGLQTELRQFCFSLFGQEKFDGVPDPSVDWQGFVSEIGRFNSEESKTYDPIKKRVLPWVDIKELNRRYGGTKTCACAVM